MNAPLPTERHARLARLAGTWKGPETVHPAPWAPEGASTNGVMTCRPACGGLFLVTDYAQSKDGTPCFTGHGVYGWDEAEACFTMHWADSMTPGGFIRAVRGAWEGDTLAFTTEGMPATRYAYRFDGSDALEFRIESSSDGGSSWACLMEARYERA